MFYVGQKVVCVAKGDWELTLRDYPETIVPKKGEIYTIRDVYLDSYIKEVGIRLVEIVNGPIKSSFNTMNLEIGWYPHDFRPVTDISIFHEILAKVNNKSKVDA